MSRCESCGNDYARPITVTVDGEAHELDSFECAIHALAPRCGHCLECGVRVYCGANCARDAGACGLIGHTRDGRAGAGTTVLGPVPNVRCVAPV